jgi:hypothetical protein
MGNALRWRGALRDRCAARFGAATALRRRRGAGWAATDVQQRGCCTAAEVRQRDALPRWGGSGCCTATEQQRSATVQQRGGTEGAATRGVLRCLREGVAKRTCGLVEARGARRCWCAARLWQRRCCGANGGAGAGLQRGAAGRGAEGAQCVRGRSAKRVMRFVAAERTWIRNHCENSGTRSAESVSLRAHVKTKSECVRTTSTEGASRMHPEANARELRRR